MAARRPRNERAKDDDAPLQHQIDTLRRQVRDLQDEGGNADAKLVRRRFEFMEGRLQELERMSTALLDIEMIETEWLVRHLGTRHDVGVELTEALPDVILARKVRHRINALRESVQRRRPNSTASEAPRDPSAPPVQR